MRHQNINAGNAQVYLIFLPLRAWYLFPSQSIWHGCLSPFGLSPIHKELLHADSLANKLKLAHRYVSQSFTGCNRSRSLGSSGQPIRNNYTRRMHIISLKSCGFGHMLSLPSTYLIYNVWSVDQTESPSTMESHITFLPRHIPGDLPMYTQPYGTPKLYYKKARSPR